MRRIIGKVDYELYKIGEKKPELALEIWNKIKDKEYILSNAIKISEDKNGKSHFLAPSICHMILSNPQDVNPAIYAKIMLKIIKNADLSRTVVFDNMSFLYLALATGVEGLDDYYLGLISQELKWRIDGNTMLNKVNYNEINQEGKSVVSYQDEELDLSLNQEEVMSFGDNKQYVINEIPGDLETEKFVKLLTFGSLENSIKGIMQKALDDYFYHQRQTEAIIANAVNVEDALKRKNALVK